MNTKEPIEINNSYIIAFKEYGEKLKKVINGNFIMLFLTPDKICIDFLYFGSTNIDVINGFINNTFSGKNDTGINPITLSVQINKAEKLLFNEYEYKISKDVLEYYIPLKLRNIHIGYICAVSMDSSSSDDIIDIAHLFKFHLCNSINCDIELYGMNSPKPQIFSKRQQEILVRMAKGMTAYAISRELGMSENSINFYKKSIFEKLDVNSVVQAVIKAIKNNYILLNDV